MDNIQTVDFVVFISANVFNILVSILFILRTKKMERVEHNLGIIIVSISIPLMVAVIINSIDGREWWTYILPLFLIIYCILELLFDYILKLEFRNTKLLGPYLLFFYLGSMAMIGYTFLIKEAFGFITLITYFIGLLAAWYSYSKTGHGDK